MTPCPESRHSPNFCTSQSCFLSSNRFFLVQASVIDKLMVITEPAVAGARLLGLGSKAT